MAALLNLSEREALAATSAITDSGGGTVGTSIAAGAGVYVLPIPVGNLVTLSTGNVDVATDIVLGHAFEILSWEFVTGTTAGTGSGASLVFNLAIGAVAGAAVDVGTTPSTCTVTLAGTSDIGERTAGTTVTGANTGTAAQGLTLEVAAGGTAFTAGDGCFFVKVRNLDLAGALASLADTYNDLRSALKGL